MYLTPLLHLQQKAAKTSSKMYLFNVQVIQIHHLSSPHTLPGRHSSYQSLQTKFCFKKLPSPSVAILICHRCPFRIQNYEELHKAQMIPESNKNGLGFSVLLNAVIV